MHLVATPRNREPAQIFGVFNEIKAATGRVRNRSDYVPMRSGKSDNRNRNLAPREAREYRSKLSFRSLTLDAKQNDLPLGLPELPKPRASFRQTNGDVDATCRG